MSDVIDKIKNEIDIVDVVQEYIDLSKKGKNYWGICPFHNDSNPSMSISPERQMFNCFSCGASGGVFKFVQDIEKISFKEALKKLGEKVGVEVRVSENINKYNEKQKKIIDALNDAMDFYMLSIETNEANHALKYSTERGITPKIRELFSIGYAPKDGLVSFLKKRGHDESTLINSSLMNQVGRDFFRDRLIFGIKNSFGDIVALSGRTLSNEDAKYINSQESLVFKKSNILYNWNNAREIAYKEKEVYIVEGFMDVIALYKIGIKNVVAIMGTAFTKESLQNIKDIKVNLMLDSDNAGINATIKSIRLLLENNIETNVVVNNKNKDADEILESSGKYELINVINNKQTALEYIYDIHKLKYPNKNTTDIKLFIESFKKYLKYSTPLEKDFFAHKIKEELGISEEITLNGISNYKSYTSSKPYYQKEQVKKNRILRKSDVNYNKPSYTLIRSLLRSKPLCDFYEKEAMSPFFIDDVLITLSTYILKAQKGEKKIPLKYKKYIDEHIGLNGEFVENPEELRDLIKKINKLYKQYGKDLNNDKINK